VRRIDWALRIILLVCIIANAGISIANWRLRQKMIDIVAAGTARLDALNRAAGCDGSESKIVPYHDGMTLCPGQSAVGPIIIAPEPEPMIPRAGDLPL